MRSSLTYFPLISEQIWDLYSQPTFTIQEVYKIPSNKKCINFMNACERTCKRKQMIKLYCVCLSVLVLPLLAWDLGCYSERIRAKGVFTRVDQSIYQLLIHNDLKQNRYTFKNVFNEVVSTKQKIIKMSNLPWVKYLDFMACTCF